MFDLKGILKDIGVKDKVEHKQAMVGIVEESRTWTLEQKSVASCKFNLTPYQTYWLMWRIKVHLKSYENFEWSEMKDVLQTILVTLEEEWTLCQSTHAPSAKESSLSGPPIRVDFVLTSPGL